MLKPLSYAMANIRSPIIKECERTFSCQLNPSSHPNESVQKFESRNLPWGVEHLDIRIGNNNGMIVASFEQAIQRELVKQLDMLGKVVEIDVVSPPINPLSSPGWTRKWSIAYALLDTKIWFGLEERKDTEYLLYASRHFALEALE